MAVEHVIEEGNQWRALAAHGHVRGAKIGDHRHAKLRSDDGCFAGLPRARYAATEEEPRVALVVERLSVTADQFAFQPRATLRGANSIGIEFTKQEIQPRKIGDAGRACIHRCQNSTPHVVRVRELIMRQQFETRAESAPLDAHQRDVDSICRGAAHDTGNDHAGTSFAVSVFARTSSLNSHISRRNLSTVLCDGAAAVRAFSACDFFFAARTRCAFCETSAANFFSLSAFLYTASNARHTLSSLWHTRNMSAPARSVSTAASSTGAAARTPPMSRSSVRISPR